MRVSDGAQSLGVAGLRGFEKLIERGDGDLISEGWPKMNADFLCDIVGACERS